MAKQFQTHPFEPIFDKDSRILILGSFPSVKSRENNFYYWHPQNRFWKVLASLLKKPGPETIEEKKAFLLSNHIAVWDTVAYCKIENSDDSSISNVKANDLSLILKNADIKAIYTNGKTSAKLYGKYIEPQINIKATVLPSTSPANAAWNLQRLCEAWQIILKEL